MTHPWTESTKGLNAIGKDEFTPPAAWDACFEFIWPKLGLRLDRTQPRIAAFVRPPDTKFLDSVTIDQRQNYVKHMAAMDIRYLLDQARRPGAVYILDDGTLHGHTDRWVGGIDGFEIRLLSCTKDCTQRRQLMAAMGVEWHPEALLLFVTAERLMSDQVVLENLRCAQQKLVHATGNTKYCGYYMHMRGDRFVEMAMLRRQLNNNG